VSLSEGQLHELHLNRFLLQSNHLIAPSLCLGCAVKYASCSLRMFETHATLTSLGRMLKRASLDSKLRPSGKEGSPCGYSSWKLACLLRVPVLFPPARPGQARQLSTKYTPKYRQAAAVCITRDDPVTLVARTPWHL
jgi:hypothetical protein